MDRLPNPRYERGIRRGECVFCALSFQHQLQYRTELATLRKQGLDVMLEASPDLAISRIEAARPAVVVVGTTLGSMEWFEFVTLLATQHRDLDAQVVVMPEKDDPFPAVIRTRDPITGAFTGHYLTPGLRLDEIVATIAALDGAGPETSMRQLAVGSGPIDLAKLDPGEH